MAYDDATMSAVRARYLSGEPIEKISIETGVAEGTITRWKKNARNQGDDWDRLKTAYCIKNGEPEDISKEILRLALLEFQITLEQLHSAEISPLDKAGILAKLADAHNKLVSSSRRVLPETLRLTTALEVIDHLAEYVAKHKPELLNAFVAMLEPFGKRLPELLAESAK
jgi:transposase-like protein